jgi:L-2,4-diaminobutyrate decarboxylase
LDRRPPGSQSNLQALLIARNHAVSQLRQKPGLQSERLPVLLDRLRIFASEASHFSIEKSASLLGLGYDGVIPVPCDPNQRMDPAALREALAASRARGEFPLAIVATAGTTDFGSIDPLAALSALAEESGAWLHVDAAYGGGLITSLRYGHLLDGIGAADSVTVDYHKTFFQPVSSSAVLVRDGAMLGHVAYYADYLNPQNPAGTASLNQVDKSIQTTRRFDALKLWLTLRIMGPDGIGALLDESIDLARQAGELLAHDPDFELAAPAQLSTLVFRYLPQVAGSPGGRGGLGVPDGDPGLDGAKADALNLHIRQAIFASGKAVIAGTKVQGRHYLKFTLLNAETTLEDLQEILAMIRSIGAGYLAGERA